MLILSVLWPLTVSAYFAGIVILARRAWIHRTDRRTTRTIAICGLLQVVAPILGVIIARLIWRPTNGIDPREAIVVSAALLTLLASLITGMIVGRKRNSQQSVPAYVAQGAPSAEP